MKAVIFDLDGVIVSTDALHYRAWKTVADQEGIFFDEHINERLRGVSRMESLEIILERASRTYTEEQKLLLATQKNDLYVTLLHELTPSDILPGITELLKKLKDKGCKAAIGSSSKNAKPILERIGLGGYFDAVSDGNNIIRSKPSPEVFLVAAQMLGVEPAECAVIEDADSGIEAACAAGMRAVAVRGAAANPKAAYGYADTAELLNCEWL